MLLMQSYELCPRSQCQKPLVNEQNIYLLRKRVLMYMAGGTITGLVIGSWSLPYLGFKSVGVASASYAAGWQSTIGSVAAGSSFSILQSLGATKTGILIFGAIGGATGGGALGVMSKYSSRFGWCECKTPFWSRFF